MYRARDPYCDLMSRVAILEVEDAEIRVFQRLGLTEYESRLYLSLIKHGPTKASQLSFFGQVPRVKAYGALRELHRKGFLRIIPGKPELYEASSPNEVLFPFRVTSSLHRMHGFFSCCNIKTEGNPISGKHGPNEPMCHMIRGFYAGFLEGYVRKRVKHSEQLTCRALGAPYCTFEITLEQA
jgi:hypothetical protein